MTQIRMSNGTVLKSQSAPSSICAMMDAAREMRKATITVRGDGDWLYLNVDHIVYIVKGE